MNITEIATMLFGNVEPDERWEGWAQETIRERDYLQRKLNELEDDQVYEMEEFEGGWSITRYAVTKRTDKFIHLSREDIYSKGFRLPRGPLEAGESARRRGHYLQLGQTIRPRLEQLVESYATRAANHEAELRQRVANRRRWGVAITDQELEGVTRLASLTSIRNTPISDKPNWIKEGF
jgi:hypothetical protein